MRVLLILLSSLMANALLAQSNQVSFINPLLKKNLVINGDAESLQEGGKVSGWHIDTAFVHSVSYGSIANGLPVDTNKYAQKGNKYFLIYGKNDSVERAMKQDISLFELSDSISNNNILFYLAGNLGGRDSIPGSAFLMISFYDTRGLKTGSWSTQPVSAKERYKMTRIVRREIRDTIPPNSVRATIELRASRGSTCKDIPGPTCPWEVYADNISFVIIPPLLLKGKPVTSKAGAGKPTPAQSGKP